MLLRTTFAIACVTALAVASVVHAAAPPATTGDDTISSAVVDDRGLPEDLPTREPATGAPRADAANPLRRAPPADAASPALAKAEGDGTAAKGDGCGQAGCTACARKVPVCKPKWGDKKTKKASFTMTCDWECVRPWEPWCQGACCEEKTTPCAGVYPRKKLYKTEEERCERVLTYEREMKPAGECCDAAPVRECLGCRILGETVHRLLSRCHH